MAWLMAPFINYLLLIIVTPLLVNNGFFTLETPYPFFQ